MPSQLRLFFHLQANPYTIEGLNLPLHAVEEYDYIFRNQLSTSVLPSRTGLGLFAEEFFLPGECFLEYSGERVTTTEFYDRAARYEANGWNNEYVQQVIPDLHVDATLHGNNARFINHCCVPDCEVTAVNLGNSGYTVPWLCALRTIPTGT